MRAPGRRELTRDQRVRQAISRLSFGARPGDFDRVSAMGVDRWIDQQLAPETIRDADADRVLSTFETQRKQIFELIADHPDPQELQQRFNQRKLANGVAQVRSSADSAATRASPAVVAAARQ